MPKSLRIFFISKVLQEALTGLLPEKVIIEPSILYKTFAAKSARSGFVRIGFIRDWLDTGSSKPKSFSRNLSANLKQKRFSCQENSLAILPHLISGEISGKALR